MRQLTKDIEYYITMKEKYADFLQSKQQNAKAVFAEIKILEQAKARLDLQEQLLAEQQQKINRVQNYEHYKKIANGLSCAIKHAVLTGQPAWKLQHIESNPEHYIFLMRDLLQFYKQGEKELNELEELQDYSNSTAREIHSMTCECYGYNTKHRFFTWKRKCEKRNKG